MVSATIRTTGTRTALRGHLDSRSQTWMSTEPTIASVYGTSDRPPQHQHKPWSRVHTDEVVMKHGGELLAVGHPVRGRRVVLQPLDPVAVEFMDGRVDAVALEPAVPERAAVAERRVRAAFGEPR